MTLPRPLPHSPSNDYEFLLEHVCTHDKDMGFERAVMGDAWMREQWSHQRLFAYYLDHPKIPTVSGIGLHDVVRRLLAERE